MEGTQEVQARRGLAGLLATDILDSAGDGVIATDAEGLVLYANPALEGILGWKSGDLEGKPLLTIVPEEYREAHKRGFKRYMETRSPVIIDQAVEVPGLCVDGSVRPIELRVSAYGDGDDTIILGIVRDLADRSERRRLEATTRSLAATQQVAVKLGLSAATTLAEAADVVLEAVGTHLDWDAGTLWEAQEDGKVAASKSWYAPGVTLPLFTEATKRLRLEPGQGVPGSVYVSGEPLWLQDLETNPLVIRAKSMDGIKTLFAFPLLDGDRVLAVLELVSSEMKNEEEFDLVGISTVGRQVGQFIARRQAEKERAEQLSFLAEVSTELDTSLDFDTTLATLAGLCVPRLADVAVVDLCVEGETRTTVRAVTTDAAAVIGEVRRRFDGEEDADLGRIVARTGQGVLVEDALAVIAEAGLNPEHEALLKSFGPSSALAVPILARGQGLGALTLITTAERKLTADDLALASEVGRRAGVSLENARLHSALAKTARKLQENLLPPSLPEIEGLEIAAQYLAAGEVEAGGDFYDIFSPTPGTWIVVVGDVLGKGVDAAGVTGLVRHTLRANATATTTPAEMLQKLNRDLLKAADHITHSVLCTVVCLAIRPHSDGASVTLASGGHPLPMLRRGDGSVEDAGLPGSMLGAFDEAEFPEAELELHALDTLVLYTDGVTERRNKDVFLGETGLKAILASSDGDSADGLSRRIVRTVEAYATDAPKDDLAVICLRAQPYAVTQSANLLLPCDRKSAGEARRFVEECLAEWGATECTDAALLLVSEVVTNAVVHANSEADLRVCHVGSRVRIEVVDSSSAAPQVKEAEEEATGGRGMALVEVLSLDWGIDQVHGGKRVWFELEAEDA